MLVTVDEAKLYLRLDGTEEDALITGLITRSSYTVSASIATENLKKGANGRVGIELIIEYEDGSEETRFVELY